jgi:hypothetical protein
MGLRVKEKNKEAQLCIDPKRGKTIDLYIQVRERKLHADCQSFSAKRSTSAEPFPQLGQAVFSTIPSNGQGW